MPIAKVLNGRLSFYCLGCKDTHSVPVNQPESQSPRWGFNGDVDKPTLTPSILIRGGHFVPGQEGKECWCTWNEKRPEENEPFHCFICHSFVKDGQIQYLFDCTHELAGKTVDLPDIPLADL